MRNIGSRPLARIRARYAQCDKHHCHRNSKGYLTQLRSSLSPSVAYPDICIGSHIIERLVRLSTLESLPKRPANDAPAGSMCNPASPIDARREESASGSTSSGPSWFILLSPWKQCGSTESWRDRRSSQCGQIVESGWGVFKSGSALSANPFDGPHHVLPPNGYPFQLRPEERATRSKAISSRSPWPRDSLSQRTKTVAQ